MNESPLAERLIQYYCRRGWCYGYLVETKGKRARIRPIMAKKGKEPRCLWALILDTREVVQASKPDPEVKTCLPEEPIQKTVTLSPKGVPLADDQPTSRIPTKRTKLPKRRL